MKLGIMQPYFFPYVGYFDCIYKTDRWIVFDVVQYTPKSWMTRNRILHPSSGWQYIKVPVKKHKRFAKIKDIKVKAPEEAKERIAGQLQHYKKKAPYFRQVLGLVEDAFSRRLSDSLVDINIAAMAAVCERIEIPFEYEVLSKMGIELPEIEHPGQWALEISHALRADTYINPPGGRELFRSEEFKRRDINLEFAKLVSFEYSCPGYAFIPHLSILDVLMWNAPESVTAYLKDTAKRIHHA